MNSNRKRNNGRRASIILPACVVLIIVVALTTLPVLPPSLVLRVEGRAVYEKMIDSPEFEVDFTHSVNKGRIREIYRIDAAQGVFTLEHGYFQSYGAGMLDTAPETDAMNFRQEGDYFVLDFPPQWRRSIAYIGGNIARHVLVYGEDEIRVGETYPKKSFTVSISRRSPLQRLLRR